MGEPLAAGRGRGIALAYADSTPAAQVAEVTVAENGKVKVDRSFVPLIAINPDVIGAQMEALSLLRSQAHCIARPL